jgi:ubiquinone/menaquinone biosynthesis C-methylase UbiE
MKQLFWVYSHIAMPVMGRLISHDSTAYTYLPASMEAFPQAEVMEQILRKDYAVAFAADPRSVYAVGLNIDSQKRTITSYEICKLK